VQRDRTPLEELRQLAEAALLEDAPEEPPPCRSTDCLGVCSPGHVMGIADPDGGAWVFNAMDNPDAVRRLVDSLNEGRKRGRYRFPPELRENFEGHVPPERIGDLPWKASE